MLLPFNFIKLGAEIAARDAYLAKTEQKANDEAKRVSC